METTTAKIKITAKFASEAPSMCISVKAKSGGDVRDWTRFFDLVSPKKALKMAELLERAEELIASHVDMGDLDFNHWLADFEKFQRGES